MSSSDNDRQSNEFSFGSLPITEGTVQLILMFMFVPVGCMAVSVIDCYCVFTSVDPAVAAV